MALVKKVVQKIFQAGEQIARKMEASSVEYAATRTGAVFIPSAAASVKWGTVITNAFDDAANTFSFSGKYLAQTYISAQAKKEERANEMMGPVWTELKDKSSELLERPLSESSELKDNLSEIKSRHKETEKQIKHVEKGVSWMNKLTGPELQATLSLETSTMSTITRFASTSAKIVTTVSPVARVVNTVFTTYEVAKALYPEQTVQVENYVKDKIDEHAGGAKEQISDLYTNATLSFRENMQNLKKTNDPDASKDTDDTINDRHEI